MVSFRLRTYRRIRLPAWLPGAASRGTARGSRRAVSPESDGRGSCGVSLRARDAFVTVAPVTDGYSTATSRISVRSPISTKRGIVCHALNLPHPDEAGVE